METLQKSAQPALPDIAVGAEDAGAGSIAQCINAMLEKEGINISVNALIEGGETPKSILNNTMKDMQVLDLTGCKYRGGSLLCQLRQSGIFHDRKHGCGTDYRI